MASLDPSTSRALEALIKYAEALVSMIERLRALVDSVEVLEFAKARAILGDIIRMDTEADRYRRGLMERVLPRVGAPEVRERLHVLLRMLDHVGEWVKAGCRHLDLVPIMNVPAELRAELRSLIDLAKRGAEAVVSALEALLAARLEEAYKRGEDVERVEEEADEALHRAQRKIVELAARGGATNVAYIVYLNELFKALESVTDYEEDAADLIRSLTFLLGAGKGAEL